MDRFKKFARLCSSFLISDAIISIFATMRGKRTSHDLVKSTYRFKEANPDLQTQELLGFSRFTSKHLEESNLKRRIGRSGRQKKSQIGSNAPPHTAIITKQWLANNGIPVLDWPHFRQQI